MSTSNFIDHVKLYAQAGKGGAGAVHFRREKSVPKGGPDGGDGGRGGHIILQGSAQLSTLLHLRYRKHVTAAHGQSGAGGCRFGATGADVVLQVPLGTVAKDGATGQILLEIIQEGTQKILMRGGRGGLGNVHFKSATQQTPRYAQPGEPGVEGWVVLELKLLADVGLVGLPNAGKSTLLSVVSAAKPKIADYPFTTLVPQLGIVACRDKQSFVMADIPGIIEGAATGRGLGTRFLRHIERNAVLLFVIAADSPDIRQTYDTLVQELRAHDPELLDKPRLLVLSKTDLLDKKDERAVVTNLPSKVGYTLISSITGQGIDLLKDKIWQLLHA
ncbi:MAG: GTPase ObgE [Amoebophilaceae bacterium]|nr:GTPase ObgE [Amoebophilaceae bacterium]